MLARADQGSMSPAPLFVDLDDTLIQTDLVWECVLRAVKENPIVALLCVVWLLKGVAHLKAQLAAAAHLDVELLPVRQSVVDHIEIARAEGAAVYLATASDRTLADAIAGRLLLFDGVLATADGINLKGSRKLARIQEVADGLPFRYIGDSRADGPIWAVAASCGLVNAPREMARSLHREGRVEFSVDDNGSRLKQVLRAIRVQQWVKNLLVFLPMVAASAFTVTALLQSLVAFVAFSLTASAVYLINDMCDLDSDRVHPKKRLRPFASGRLPLAWGIAIAPLLLSLALAVASTQPLAFLIALGIYAVTTFAYSLRLKQVAALDVFILALLYTLRVIGGAAAITVVPSFWLISFSFFLFFSLAVTKRYSELFDLRAAGGFKPPGRGYGVSDIEVMGGVGLVAGGLAVLVFALYINSDVVTAGYRHPVLLWPVCGLLFFWVVRLWLMAARGEVNQDPIVHAVKDPVTWLVGFVSLVLFVAAKLLQTTLLP
jgi:4-hydroxybenzoate polyprenyltransferase/phosphoserine phosphatase